jgi:ribosome assembly protein RRB1
MGKKSKRSQSSNKQEPSESQRLAPAQRSQEEEEETAENLRFQDPFVDEIIDDDADAVGDDGDEKFAVNEGGGEEDNDDGMDVEVVQSWHPLMGGTPPDEPLEMDPSAYKMYHNLTPEWPCLSFDFLRDTLGDARQRFPHSLQAVIGTQADAPENNKLTVLKLSDLSKLPQENDEEDILDDDKDDDGSSSSDEEDIDLDPIMEHYSLPHYGGINRVRAMPQLSDIVATWSDVGKVNIFNVAHLRSRFNASEGKPFSSTYNNKPTFSHSGHGIEGYALDWSSVKEGHLATGDNNGNIHLWTPHSDGSYEVTPSYESVGEVSVEELQWSPSESTVFCAAESGGFLSIYDTRAPNRAMLRHLTHEKSKADVNVVSWNRHVSNLLATGGDDGTLSVWDLRQFSAKVDLPAPPLARFSCHKTPITSVEWHPTDESMLAVSDSVGAYIYDLSVEEDTEKDTTSQTTTLVADIPPQLLFCHSGSQDFKELHWHPQISSCIMTTAFSGFSVFIPSNL